MERENNKVSGSKSSLATIAPYARYIGRRLLSLIPVLIVISIVVYILINLMPGDPVTAMLDPQMTKTMTPDERAKYVETMRELLGYDKGLVARYFIWMRDTFIRGDFGYSVRYNKPVNEIIWTYIARSFKINIWGFLLAFLISIPVGIQAAVKKNKFFDKSVTVLTIVGISLPSFFLALLLIMLFTIALGWLPFSGMSDPRGVVPAWKYLVLPITVVVLTSLASLIRYIRSAMVDVLDADYVRTARAKGLKEKVVIYRHAFQNALIPVVTLIGMYIPSLFGGSIVVERIFAYPGMGFLLGNAYSYKDRAVLQTALLFFGLLTLLGNIF
ncbi:MAG TPA: ABC transporter permease, partial [Clostridia bacterium]|nr:ABC transporter permease [Clostridia bacterium]